MIRADVTEINSAIRQNIVTEIIISHVFGHFSGDGLLKIPHPAAVAIYHPQRIWNLVVKPQHCLYSPLDDGETLTVF